ncbi:MAG: hypothetical protein ACI4PP_03105, partial [Clostridia bacterium]
GLKENVILGKLIPAGTGMLRYRDIEVSAEGDAPETIAAETDETTVSAEGETAVEPVEDGMILPEEGEEIMLDNEDVQ